MAKQPVIEEYFVIRFSSGTFYDGTRYSSNTLVKAVKFTEHDEVTKQAEKLSEERFVEVAIVPIIVKECIIDKELFEASQQALSLLKGEKEFEDDLTIYGPGGKNVVRINRVIDQLQHALEQVKKQNCTTKNAERSQL